MTTDDLTVCPGCGASWIGEPIPIDIRHHFRSTHFRRCIGYYDMHLDITIGHQCPDCNSFFDRWTAKEIPLPSNSQ